MKTLVSIFLIAVSLLAEVSALAGNHWCEIERVKMETTGSSETCENQEPTLVKNQVRKTHFAKLSVLALIYNTKDVLHITNQAVDLLYHQNPLKKSTSPIYLNNSVFLI
jgi:hypothetical protein